MNAKRWMLIGLIGGCWAALAPGVRPSHAATLATAVGPGVPVLRLGEALQPPATLGLNFDDQSLRKAGPLAPVLDKLFRIDQLGRAGNHAVTSTTAPALPGDLGGLVSTNRLRVDDAGRVQVWVDTTADPDAAIGSLIALGMQVQRVDGAAGIVQGMLPIGALSDAAELPQTAAVRLPSYGVVGTGSALTQGDAILNAATLRNTLTANGSGVRVGVISDGMEGLAASQATSDLGPVDTTTCNVALQASVSPPPPPPSPTASGAGAEGTAMAEIVHDVAPGAQIFFGYFGMNFGGTALDFNAAVNCLALHTDVVVDDLGWFNSGPDDGTSLVSANTSAALNSPANPIRGYYTAVANQAQDHYRGAYVDSGYHVGNLSGDWWELDRFQGGGGTTDAGYGLQCSASVRCGDTIQVAPGASFTVLVQWNDPYGSSANDYDLLVQDNTAATVALASADRQTGAGSDPTESFSVVNNHGVATVYNILIGKYKNLAATRTFDMFILCSGCYAFSTGLPAPDNYAAHNYNTLAGSVPNQSDATGGVVSVGAISAADSPGYNVIEGYSSRGPTADARTKPDVAAIDCVAITGAAGFYNPFCGSSAAAPHAAGIAALLLSCNPMLLAGSPSGTPASDRTTLHDALLNSAVDLGAPGVDNTFGHGRVDAVAAAPLAGCVDTDGDGYPDGVETALGENASTYCATIRADVNGDGKVNLTDLILLAGWYNHGEPPAPSRYDQNVPSDSKITLSDLILVAGQYPKQVSTCP